MRKPVIAVLAIIAMASCRQEKPFSYEYLVTNNCDTAISVAVKRPNTADTTIVIHKGAMQRIHFSFLYQKAKSPTFRELNNDFDTIIMYKYHIASQNDYMKSKNWTFVKYSDVLGRYTTTLTNNDF